MTRKKLIIGVVFITIVCSFVSGCSALVREERSRELDEDFAKGKINKVQYLSSKHNLEQEQAKIVK